MRPVLTDTPPSDLLSYLEFLRANLCISCGARRLMHWDFQGVEVIELNLV